METLLNLDGNILIWIQEFLRNPILDPFFKVITTLGNAGIFWIIATILLLIPEKTRKVGMMSAFALLGSLLVNNILLKNLVARTRPYYVVEGLIPLIKKPSEFSFPSGHAASSFASARVLYRNLPKKYGVWFLALAIFISFSRLYVGVHYPSDVLAGVVTGIICSYLGQWIVNHSCMKKNT
ncbi:phosphatase PAP2 family protein [Parablautia muri]|uniref:Phosphatase PAP2 family protein n=1 Tax=Parablautia muri TaxID=2320879 RepID=A0A9X5BHN8_9FIRM|nr:phosphatase PAP2 family protein [Parablautia muri]NBJ93812.1 phosphatase PAP2 family protein [Parablautia muri]